MGLFNRKPDNRVKCPECDGQGVTGFSTIQNPEPRPSAPRAPTETSHRYEMAGGWEPDNRAFFDYQENISVPDKCPTCDGKKKVSPDVAESYMIRRENEKIQLRDSMAAPTRENAIRLLDELLRSFSDCKSLTGPLFNTMSALEKISSKNQSAEIDILNKASQKLFSKIDFYERDLQSNSNRSQFYSQELSSFRQLGEIISKMIEDKATAIGVACKDNCLAPVPQDPAKISKPNLSPLQLQIDACIKKCEAEIKSLTEQGEVRGRPYLSIKYLIDKSFEQLSTITSKKQNNQISPFNYTCVRAFFEFESLGKVSDSESKVVLESLYHNFNEVIRLKAEELGMRYAFRDMDGLKIFSLENWS